MMRYTVIDLYDGGTGRTVVSRHRTREAAERAAGRRNAATRRAHRDALDKYGVDVEATDASDPTCQACGAVMEWATEDVRVEDPYYGDWRWDGRSVLVCAAHPWQAGHVRRPEEEG